MLLFMKIEKYTFLIVFDLIKLSHYVNPHRNKLPE